FEFKGKNFIDRQVEDLMASVKSDGYAWMCSPDEKKIREYGASADDTFQNFVQANNIDERIIVPHGHDYFISRPKVYRWIAPEVLGKALWIVYADRISFLIWEKPMRCIIIRNQSLCDIYKRQFLFMWKQAKVPPIAAMGKKPAR
ncbi:hypothetical protein EBR96_10075, partial [bacterium]|nr:hypothetical protein [bacterium]